jgi:hypothetical protein
MTTTNPTTTEQRVCVSLEISEFGCGHIFVCADSTEQARDGHLMLAAVQPELRALALACKRAAAKILGAAAL